MRQCAAFSKSNEIGLLNGGGSYICGIVEGGATNNCHGNMGSPLICPMTTSCGKKSTALAGILGWRADCDAKKQFLFAGVGYIKEIFSNFLIRNMAQISLICVTNCIPVIKYILRVRCRL